MGTGEPASPWSPAGTLQSGQSPAELCIVPAGLPWVTTPNTDTSQSPSGIAECPGPELYPHHEKRCCDRQRQLVPPAEESGRAGNGTAPEGAPALTLRAGTDSGRRHLYQRDFPDRQTRRDRGGHSDHASQLRFITTSRTLVAGRVILEMNMEGEPLATAPSPFRRG